MPTDEVYDLVGLTLLRDRCPVSSGATCLPFGQCEAQVLSAIISRTRSGSAYDIRRKTDGAILQFGVDLGVERAVIGAGTCLHPFDGRENRIFTEFSQQTQSRAVEPALDR